MNPVKRIPTCHELKLASRVERARILFEPGGYLPSSEVRCKPEANSPPDVQEFSMGASTSSAMLNPNAQPPAITAQTLTSNSGDGSDFSQGTSQRAARGKGIYKSQVAPPACDKQARQPDRDCEQELPRGLGVPRHEPQSRTIITVVFSIIGGRSGGVGFTASLQQKDKVGLRNKSRVGAGNET